MLHNALLILALLANTSVAMISGFTTPKNTLYPGQKFNVTFKTSNYIQFNQQYYALFGMTPSTAASPNALGITTLGGKGKDLVLSGNSVTGYGQFDVQLQIPEGFKTLSGKKTKYTITTSVLNTVGASNSVYLQWLNDTITIAPK